MLFSRLQADGNIKKRPAVVLREMPRFRDFLVCGISTQLHQQVKGFDEIISRADADFSTSGLLSDSLIRLGFLSVIPLKDIEGAIGTISPKRHKRLLKSLCDYLIGKRVSGRK
ncbi:MAG TPA: transcriptional regulator [Thermodesulfobacteriota bacterium]|nr:transcriptional regulator [Thermodesulfobacteriota bacterium]